jgi:hypothetical protein
MSTELRVTQTAVAAGPRAGAVSGSLGATLGRETNAVFAIAWREILRAVKSPLSLAFTVIFPILFIGILGGSIGQNSATPCRSPTCRSCSSAWSPTRCTRARSRHDEPRRGA